MYCGKILQGKFAWIGSGVCDLISLSSDEIGSEMTCNV